MIVRNVVAGLLMCVCTAACRTTDRPDVNGEHAPVAKLPSGPQQTEGTTTSATFTLESDNRSSTFRWGGGAAGASDVWIGGNVLRGDAAQREIGARAQIVKSTDTRVGGGALTLTFTYADGCAGRVRTADGKEPEFEFRPSQGH